MLAGGGGRPRLSFTFREIVRSVQYGSEEHSDDWEVYGMVLCEAELEGIPDVTLPVVWDRQVDYVTVHPCCRPADAFVPDKLCFSPPLGPFTLCRYRLKKKAARMPIRGYFQMKVRICCSLRMRRKEV